MEVECTAPEKTSVDQLLKFYKELLDVKDTLQNHESLSNGQTESLNVNLKMEVKYLKKLFISMFSYVTFLDNIVKPKDEWVTEKEIADQIAESTALLTEVEEKYQNTKEKQVALLEMFKEYDVFMKNAASCVEIVKEIEMNKKECEEMAEKRKMRLEAFPEECKNSEDAAKLIQEKEKAITKLKNEIFLKILPEKQCSDQQATLNRLLSSLLQFEEMHEIFVDDVESNGDSPADEDSAESLYKVLGGIQLIDSQPSFDIIEVFYSDTNNKESSVVIKIIFQSDRNMEEENNGVIKSIHIENSPILVDDLIHTAIATNNFSIVLPELRRRLFET